MTIRIHVVHSREEYHNAWKFMYYSKKHLYQDKIYDEVLPLTNKQLGTETDVVSAIAYDDSILHKDGDEILKIMLSLSNAVKRSNIDVMKNGIPVGIQSWVVTKSKIIGKQMIVDPEYGGKGICTAMMLAAGHELKNAKVFNDESITDRYDHAYIGCSSNSKPILEHKFKLRSFMSDEEDDMYKFNIPINDLLGLSEYGKEMNQFLNNFEVF